MGGISRSEGLKFRVLGLGVWGGWGGGLGFRVGSGFRGFGV